MRQTRTAGANVETTLVEFLRNSVRHHGPRDALLFKPGFRYQRWSYDRLWRESGQVASLLQSRGLDKGRPGSPVGAQLAAVGAHTIRMPARRRRGGAPGPAQRPRLRGAGHIQDNPQAGLHVALHAQE